MDDLGPFSCSHLILSVAGTFCRFTREKHTTQSEMINLVPSAVQYGKCSVFITRTVYLLSFAFLVCVAGEQQRTSAFCPCEKPDDDFMIVCDEQGCKCEWFHFVSVGLDGKSIPDGDWYCPECFGKRATALCFRCLNLTALRKLFHH